MTTILITGSTDGIGFETAKRLASEGHEVILHGRSSDKLRRAEHAVVSSRQGSVLASVNADLSKLDEIDKIVQVANETGIDVLVNNAGVYNTPTPITADGLDIRFVVNAIAPYYLTRRLVPSLPADGRVVNLSSAAQAPVDLDALRGDTQLDDGSAYAQSKLALTMWSRHMAEEVGPDGPAVIAVNPGSLLATKMVKDAFGVSGNDVDIGSDILTRAALSDEFADATGRYYDNDSRRFAPPHPDALDPDKTEALIETLDQIIARLSA